MQTGSSATVTRTFASSNAVECEFDSDGAAHLMSVLSNMYRDAPSAVLREYAANARDAHVQAGNPDPIRITLPTEWDPTLTIADEGTGLSCDEIVGVYSRYGKSTKRETNEQVGAFGIGAKSAFTISTQFTVTGVKDGWKTTALFALNDAGVGTVDIRGIAATEEPNGVKVSIAVDDPAAVRQAADRLFATWEPGTVLIDGKQPEYLPDSMLRVTDTVYAHRNGFNTDRPHETPGITVVMGGIPYPASAPMLAVAARRCTHEPEVHRLLLSFMNKTTPLGLLVFVPVGAVDITPSREDLRDTPRTIALLTTAVTDYVSTVEAAVGRVLDAEPTPMHVSARIAEFAGFVPHAGTKGITWRGRHLRGQINPPYPTITLHHGPTRNRTEYEPCPSFHLGQDFSRTLVVTGVDTDGEKAVRRLANRYMTQHDLTTLILSSDDTATVGWFSFGGDSPLPTVALEDFKEQAKALPTVTTRREPSYDVLVGGHWQSLPCSRVKELACGGRVLVTSGYHSAEDLRHIRESLGPADVLVMLTGRQTRKAFQRRFPSAVDAATHIRDHARRTLDEASDTERLALEFRRNDWLERLCAVPELRDLEPLRDQVEAYLERRRALAGMRAERMACLRWAERVLDIQREAPQRPRVELPLLDVLLGSLQWVHLDDALLDDVTRYLKAVRETDSAEAA